MKPITKGIIALIIAIVVALCGSLLLSFNVLIPFAITLMAFGIFGSLMLAVSLPFIHNCWS